MLSQSLIVASLVSFTYFVNERMGWPALIAVLSFGFFCQSGAGALHFVYISEVLSDTQLGFIMTICYVNGVEIATLTEYMIKYMTPEGTFLF